MCVYPYLDTTVSPPLSSPGSLSSSFFVPASSPPSLSLTFAEMSHPATWSFTQPEGRVGLAGWWAKGTMMIRRRRRAAWG